MIDGQRDTDTNSLLDRLRRLAASDPRSARAELTSLMNGQPEQARSLLERLDTPKDGRLRHLIARVAPELRSKATILPFLVRWRARETDEFTRRAIAVALGQLEEQVHVAATPDTPAPVYPAQFAETYDYVASRLKHKLNNGIMKAQAHLLRLTAAIQPDSNGAVGSAIADLKEEFRRLGIAVEATDVDPAHFEWRSIVLVPWLQAMNGRYAAQFSRIDVQFEGDLDPPVTVDASDYLIETVFWNTWLNAHQAARNPCRIVLRVKRHSGRVRLLVIDNGPGFPEAVRDGAFQEPFSTHGANRGRGLLEMGDAMRRLYGSVRLADDGTGTFRLLFEFPVARS